MCLTLLAATNVKAQAIVRWEGATDLDMYHQVQKDLALAVKKHIQVLTVSLSSPGGPVLTSLEIAKLVRDTEETTGLIVEIHASMICASGCTFVLAAGTPGHRYIAREILFLVHSMHNSTEECTVYVPDPKTQDDKATDLTFDLMRSAYMRYTGRSLAEVTHWTTCGEELVGKGNLAVMLNMADRTES